MRVTHQSTRRNAHSAHALSVLTPSYRAAGIIGFIAGMCLIEEHFMVGHRSHGRLRGSGYPFSAGRTPDRDGVPESEKSYRKVASFCV
jgi:hypothetical protein